ncbi:MAG: hypothetical protein RIQ89_2329 [Bacteroidota bacterium]|jgi:putative transcriptional regulator
MKAKTVSKGSLLIAEPFNPDPYLKRSVVLISQQDKNGSVGFVINKPTSLMIHEALEDFPKFEAMVYWGGNQNLETVYYIHTLGKKLEGSVEIGDGIWWGGKYGILKMIVEAGEVKPEEIRFFAGYFSWSPKKLASDIKNNSWWVGKANVETAFYEDPDKLWGNVLTRMGHVYGVMNDFPEDPSFN